MIHYYDKHAYSRGLGRECIHYFGGRLFEEAIIRVGATIRVNTVPTVELG